jgi:hypothetical protein
MEQNDIHILKSNTGFLLTFLATSEVIEKHYCLSFTNLSGLQSFELSLANEFELLRL